MNFLTNLYKNIKTYLFYTIIVLISLLIAPFVLYGIVFCYLFGIFTEIVELINGYCKKFLDLMND